MLEFEMETLVLRKVIVDLGCIFPAPVFRRKDARQVSVFHFDQAQRVNCYLLCFSRNRCHLIVFTADLAFQGDVIAHETKLKTFCIPAG